MAMRIDGQNGKRSQTTNLKQHKKNSQKIRSWTNFGTTNR